MQKIPIFWVEVLKIQRRYKFEMGKVAYLGTCFNSTSPVCILGVKKKIAESDWFPYKTNDVE